VDANTLTVGGAIGQSGGDRSLTKSGDGTLVLNGDNIYKGNTTVNAGSLIINGNSSTATGSVSVASGATLGGSGTIGGAITIIDGGTLSPGTSPGQLNVASLDLGGAAATFTNTFMELGGTTLGTEYDNISLAGAGALVYGGNLIVENFGVYDMDSASFTYDLFSLNGVTPTDSFNTVTVNSISLNNNLGVWTGANGGVSYTFDQAIGDLTVNAIPEPNAAALLGSLGALLLLRRRRA
ncbi:MAG TPA: autotransporter-associated beta strand repeat-containing protein, partial [Verrucomicrobiae bacterium]|nr:autotransporter-associated beta strand repeat-containing protein [Verrucomicrobiae bacterium]